MTDKCKIRDSCSLIIKTHTYTSPEHIVQYHKSQQKHVMMKCEYQQ